MNKILVGNVLERLRELPDESVHCAVTSPPYFALRDYGTATWSGGDEGHDHIGKDSRTVSGGAGKQYSNRGSNRIYSGDCACGAIRVDNQIGLESTPGEYITKLVKVFNEVRRVLRNDGTLWLNIGDSYAGSGKGPEGNIGKGTDHRHLEEVAGKTKIRFEGTGIKPKDLMGIPWMLAFALRDSGWWLRQDIIWAKPNPMPESVRDRCTKAHEYLFLLTKSDRYYFDTHAIKEPAVTNWEMSQRSRKQRVLATGGAISGGMGNGVSKGNTRNKRSVWSVTVHGYKGAHFATFPEKLVEPCILAGSPRGGAVLDPFLGSGTTASVAKRLGRQWVGCELNPTYAALAQDRIDNTFGPRPKPKARVHESVS